MTTAPPTTPAPVELTSDGYVGANAYYTSNPPELGVDNNAATYWVSAIGGGIGSWYQITFPYRAIVNRMKLTARTGSQNQAPTEFYVYGSNTGHFAGEEVELYHASGLSWASGETKTFDISNSNYYQYYRLVISALGSGTTAAVSEFEYWNTNGVGISHLYPAYSSDLATGETATANGDSGASYVAPNVGDIVTQILIGGRLSLQVKL